jgi:hypothetical protein
LGEKDVPIPFTDFLNMPESDLLAWRNHLCDSFTENSELSAPLRFLSSNKSEPTLTVLKMGSKPQTSTKEKKLKRKRGPGTTSAKGRKSSGRKGTNRKKRSKSVVSDSSSESAESSDTDDEDTDLDAPVEKRPKSARVAAKKATKSISRTIANIEAIPNQPIRPKPRPAIPKTLPGSLEQLQIKASSKVAANSIEEANSLFLQRPCMTRGTLPDDWKRKGFNPVAVIVYFLNIYGYLNRGLTGSYYRLIMRFMSASPLSNHADPRSVRLIIHWLVFSLESSLKMLHYLQPPTLAYSIPLFRYTFAKLLYPTMMICFQTYSIFHHFQKLQTCPLQMFFYNR